MKLAKQSAFPHASGQVEPEYGLTIRAWLAGQALIGLSQTWNSEGDSTHAAKVAVAHADALLAELAKADAQFVRRNEAKS